MKPNGLAMNVNNITGISLRVNTPSKTEDLIWDAVEEAINSGWTPQQFKNEVVDAWEERLKEDIKDAKKILSK